MRNGVSCYTNNFHTNLLEEISTRMYSYYIIITRDAYFLIKYFKWKHSQIETTAVFHAKTLFLHNNNNINRTNYWDNIV